MGKPTAWNLKRLAFPLAVMMLATGCASQVMQPGTTLDTPEHHVFSGFKLMERGYLADAQREFEVALQHDAHDPAALRGLGLVHGRQGRFDEAFAALAQARDRAENDGDRALVLVDLMKLHMWQRAEGWLDAVEFLYQEILNVGKALPAAHFHMASAYKEAGRLQEAEEMCRKVIALNAGYGPEAREMLEQIRREE